MTALEQIKRDVPKIDQSANTISEMVMSTGMGKDWVRRYCAAMVRSGRWEQASKRVGRSVVRAYRPKRG